MRVAVVGGGIAGLAAAWELRHDAEITVYEPGRLGGKIRTSDFCGRGVDEGPDAFITRVPDAVELCAELGLAGELTAPAAGRTLVWSGGRLRPLPDDLLLGVPRRLGPLARSGWLSPLGVGRAALDLVLPSSPSGGDISVGELVRHRFGPEVARRLVEPLIGGIHAARIDDLSAAATAPQLLAAARRSRSLMRALRAAPPEGAPKPRPEEAPGPLFLAPGRGMGAIVDRLAGHLASTGAVVRPEAVPWVRRGRDGRVDLGVDDPFDGVVVATPAVEAVRLLGDLAPSGLAATASTSVVVVTLAMPAAEAPLPEGFNGVLVAPDDGRLMTACSFGSNKWPHWSNREHTILRVSAGRHGDDRAFALDDDTLVARLVTELDAALGLHATPVASRVSRWPASFPLYRVGHLQRIERGRADLARRAPAVVLAGASLGGAGIPACIRSGRQAARQLLGARGRTQTRT